MYKVILIFANKKYIKFQKSFNNFSATLSPATDTSIFNCGDYRIHAVENLEVQLCIDSVPLGEAFYACIL